MHTLTPATWAAGQKPQPLPLPCTTVPLPDRPVPSLNHSLPLKALGVTFTNLPPGRHEDAAARVLLQAQVWFIHRGHSFPAMTSMVRKISSNLDVTLTLHSKASSKASRWAGGVRTRPWRSVLKITDSAFIDVICATYDVYAIS